MTVADVSKLDNEKFGKVRRLMTEGATEGERNAAKARANAMARRAGMTLNQAMSKLDSASNTRPQPAAENWTDIFRDIHRKMDDEQEAKNPGYKDRKRERQAQKERAKAERRDELLRQFGSVEALFELTPIERALYVAAEPFAKRSRGMPFFGDKPFFWTKELGGSRAFDGGKRSPESLAAIKGAWPFPDTLQGLLDEVRMWAKLRSDRQLFVDGEYQDHMEVDARNELLEHELWTRPVENWDDMEARFAWDRFEWDRQWMDPEDHERSDNDKMERLRADFEILRKLYEGRPSASHVDPHHRNGGADTARHPGSHFRRTNADKRRDVASMLDAEPGLSDREIAKRCGVSPQTVGNVRRRR